MEVLISMAIFVLAILGITIMVQMSYHYYNFIFNQAEIVSNVQKSINELSKEIREMRQADTGAYNLEEAAANEIIFYSNLDSASDVERIRYFINSGCLKKGVIKPTGTPPAYVAGNEQVSNINCNVANTAGEPLFAYYKGYPAAGTLLAAPVDVHLVKIVKVFLRIKATGLTPLPSSKAITEYIRPRNVNHE
jgi:hypothetical protein